MQSGNTLAGVLDPQGPIGRAEELILIDSTAIMLAVILPVIAATLVFAWWFRAGNGKAEYWPDWAYSGRLETIVWAIPALVVLFLGGIGWVSSHDLDPLKPLDGKPVEVQVVSLDWKWLFIYPDAHIASVNRLVVPAGTPVHFRLTSATVMNSFFVPQLGSQIYTMAGMATELSLQADNPGSYPGMSAQFSGDGFADMRFTVDAMAPADYERWVTTAKSEGKPLDEAAYASLAQESKAVEPIAYRDVGQDLFDRIIHFQVPDAPGPDAGPKPDISPKSGS